MSDSPSAYCVFRLGAGLLALDALAVSEVAMMEAPTYLPGCVRAVRGVSNLRGRALAVVDLAAVLDYTPTADHGGPGQTKAGKADHRNTDQLALVLRLPGCECGVLVSAVDGVFAADPRGRRGANRAAEPAWISGFQEFAVPGAPVVVAAVVEVVELTARLIRLRSNFLSQATA